MNRKVGGHILRPFRVLIRCYGISIGSSLERATSSSPGSQYGLGTLSPFHGRIAGQPCDRQARLGGDASKHVVEGLGVWDFLRRVLDDANKNQLSVSLVSFGRVWFRVLLLLFAISGFRILLSIPAQTKETRLRDSRKKAVRLPGSSPRVGMSQ